MQDPTITTFPEIKAPFPEQEQLKCPRCESTNTKFCYYNNYNLSQPRHFCKNCRRYWTKGGALRNIPVGGGTRKNATKRVSNPKRPNPDTDSDPGRPARKIQEPVSFNEVSSTTREVENNTGQDSTPRVFDPDRKALDMGGSFASLLGGGQFGNFFDGSGLKMGQVDGFGEELNMGRDHLEGSGNSNNGGGNSNNNSGLDLEGSGNSNNEGYLQSGDWGSGNGWPDLAIYTPGSTFQ